MKKIELVVATVSGGTGRVTRNPHAEVWINCPGFPVSWENEELGLKPPAKWKAPNTPTLKRGESVRIIIQKKI